VRGQVVSGRVERECQKGPSCRIKHITNNVNRSEIFMCCQYRMCLIFW